MSEQVTASRFRSPPFPTLSLQRALERAEQIYRQERDHPAPMASLARAWGMSPTSSGPVVTVAALRQYGLVEDEGSGEGRKIRLTHDALRIILDKVPSSPTRLEAIRRAFLSPRIFTELWDRWKSDLPSEQTMINYLVLERRLNNQAPFSEQSASELLANYRASLPFACPEEELSLSAPTSDGAGVPGMSVSSADSGQFDPRIHHPVEQPEKSVTTHPAHNHGRARLMENERELTAGLLSKEANFRLIVTGKIGAKEIERLIRKLELDKDILADADIEDATDEGSAPRRERQSID
jgi:hypothetical protein